MRPFDPPRRLPASVSVAICTAHIECNNLTIRAFMKQSERRSPGFSKILNNLKAAAAPHVFHYNFSRIHGSLKSTPAMQSGVAVRLWNLSDLFGQAA